MKKQIKKKVWVIVFLGDDMETEGICCWGDDNGSGKMEIFETKSEATERFWSYKSKWMPDEKVKVFKVLPLTVTYSLPTRNKKK